MLTKQILILCLAFTFSQVSIAQESTDFEAKTLVELEAVNAKKLSKKDRRKLKKVLKTKRKAKEKAEKVKRMYGNILKNGKVQLQHVIDKPDLKASAMYSAAHEWLANPNNLYDVVGGYQSNQSIVSGMLFGKNDTKDFPAIIANHKQLAKITQDKENQLLYAHLVTLVENAKGFTNNIRSMFYEANLKIQFKDGRYRVTIQDISWSNWNSGTGLKFPIYPGKKHAALGCASEGTIEDLIRCPKGEKHAHKSISSYIEHLELQLTSLNQKINTATDGSDDDW